jgi:predicted MFS family arabinose efflux permease
MSITHPSRTFRVEPIVPSTHGAHAIQNRQFILAASIVVSFLASTSVPTPIYRLYQQNWGFSAVTITAIFAVYSLAVLAALLTIGELSDHIGRKPVLLLALLTQIFAMVVFATASGLSALLLARVVQGVAIGAALGAVGATLIDIDRTRSTLANAVIPTAGCAAGILISALAIEHLPYPTRLIYLVLLGVFVVQLLGVIVMPETALRRRGSALASLRPTFALPHAARRPILIAAPVVFAAWALAGFYGSLGPALVASLTDSDSAMLAGMPMFLLTAAAVATVVVFRNAAAETMFGIGVGALILGLAMTLAAIDSGTLTGLYIGTVVAGVGFGGGFQGGIRTVLPHAGPHHRAGVLSVLYSCCYLGFGAPAVLAGYLSIQRGSAAAVAREYGIALVALAALAVLGSTWRGRDTAVEQRDAVDQPTAAAGR